MTRLTVPRRSLATAALAVALPLLAWGCGSASESTTETTRAASTGCPSSVYRCVLVAFTNDLQEAVTVRADGKELGTTTLELVYHRPWETEPPADVYRIAVTVR